MFKILPYANTVELCKGMYWFDTVECPEAYRGSNYNPNTYLMYLMILVLIIGFITLILNSYYMHRKQEKMLELKIKKKEKRIVKNNGVNNE